MAQISTLRTALPTALVSAGMLLLSGPALADPADPAPNPAPAAPAPADPAAADPAAPAKSVPHLSSPENLPPGTTSDAPGQSGGRLSYWRQLWRAYQTQDVSGGDALLLLTQRPLDANATPPAGLPAGPQSVPTMTLTGPVPGTGPLAPAPAAPAAADPAPEPVEVLTPAGADVPPADAP